MLNSKGQSTVFMVILIIISLLTVIFLFVGGLVVYKINDALSLNVSLGQVNLADTNAKTWGQLNQMYLVHADWWGLSIIFGMIAGLLLSAYFMRNKYPKWGIVLDIFMIFACFIVSLYVKSSYQTLLDALNTAGEPFLETYVAKTSMFVLNLPIFVVIIGVLMMILFHSSIPRRTEEGYSDYQGGGYLQGI